MDRVFFVAKKVERVRGKRVTTFAVGEHGTSLRGFHEVVDRNGRKVTRTLHMSGAIAEKNKRQKRANGGR